MKSVLLTRALTGAVFVAILVSCTWFSPILMGVLFMIISVIGLLEFYSLTEKYEVQPQKFLGILSGVILFYYFLQRNLIISQLFKESFLSIILLLISLTYIVELFRKKEKPFLNISATLFGIIYVVVPFSFLVELGHFKPVYEPKIILGIFFLIWCNDTFAYLVGSMLGRTKLMPRISPGKTWEGFAGGAVFTLVLAWFLDDIFSDIRGFDRLDWLVIGTIIFSLGTLGDLIESMFKRSIGVKDSGKIMAGHGGILDRFDSLILTVPFIYGYLFFIKANFPYFDTLFKDLFGK